MQAGSDLTFWGGQMAVSGQATHRITSDLTGYGAEGLVDGRALGVYDTWMQDAEDDGGLYIDLPADPSRRTPVWLLDCRHEQPRAAVTRPRQARSF